MKKTKWTREVRNFGSPINFIWKDGKPVAQMMPTTNQEDADFLVKVANDAEEVKRQVRKAIALIHADEEEGGNYVKGMEILCKVAGVKFEPLGRITRQDVRDFFSEDSNSESTEIVDPQ